MEQPNRSVAVDPVDGSGTEGLRASENPSLVTESHPSDRLRALDLEAIKAREAAATKGPWRSMLAGNCNMENGLLAAIAEVEGLPRPWNPVWVGWQSAKNYFKTFLRKEDAEFVARSREDVPALIAEVERLCVLVRASQPSEGWQPRHTLDNDRQVFFYEHDCYVLSNFSAFRLDWQGQTFDTSEAAYHWEKFGGWPELQKAITAAPSAHEAFKLAERNRAHRLANWDAVKVDIMREILRAKAQQHEYVRRKLLATGDRELIEDSWRDDFWGWGPNRDGRNMMGNLWMQIRSELAPPSLVRVIAETTREGRKTDELSRVDGVPSDQPLGSTAPSNEVT